MCKKTCHLCCRADLLEALPPSDLSDMQRAVVEALEHVTGTVFSPQHNQHSTHSCTKRSWLQVVCQIVHAMAQHTRHKSGLGACEGKGLVTDSKELCGPSIELVYNDTHRSDVSELVCAEGKRMMLDKDWLLLHALQSLLRTLQASHTDNLEIGTGVSMTVVS